MKKLFLIGLVAIFFVACQQPEQRYFAESAEIDVLKAGIAAYESGDWDTWKGHFSDTAKIFVNSSTPVDIDTRLTELKGAAAAFSTYGFDKEDEFIEMVIDKDKETWVYYWAQWNGEIAANSKKISVPVHLAVQFTDGKITKEHVYFDGTTMNKEMEALANMTDLDKTLAENMNKLRQAWVDNDIATFNSLSSENVGRSVNGVKVVKNQKEYAELIQSNHNMLSDINIVTNDLFIKDNKAYINWTFSGKNTKDIPDMPATNKQVSINGFAIWSFDNEGKATYEDVYFDQNDVNIQLGFTIAPPK